MRQRQAHAQLQRQVESLESEKRLLETRIHEFKARLSNLQQELDNSVAVQNDFVRLSQSLQMELEKIRSQGTEVSSKPYGTWGYVGTREYHLKPKIFRSIYFNYPIDLRLSADIF